MSHRRNPATVLGIRVCGIYPLTRRAQDRMLPGRGAPGGVGLATRPLRSGSRRSAALALAHGGASSSCRCRRRCGIRLSISLAV
jgi:hypothetical protein